MKIVILGSSGMLGHMVFNYFKSQEGYEVIRSVRNPEYLAEDTFIFDPLVEETMFDIPKDADYVINCIGVIKPHMLKNLTKSIYVNSIFPHELAARCKSNGTKVIHITTDCVFSGMTGEYDEESLHDATDEYGKSKSLGESKNCMVIRTSIIGTEVYNNASLIAWVLAQGGKSINGFTNHFWNGITTLQFAKVCEKIIQQNLYKEELYHVISPGSVDKYELVSMINEVYEVDASVNPVPADIAVDRTLSTIKDLCHRLDIPALKVQLQEMKAFGK